MEYRLEYIKDHRNNVIPKDDQISIGYRAFQNYTAAIVPSNTDEKYFAKSNNITNIIHQMPTGNNTSIRPLIIIKNETDLKSSDAEYIPAFRLDDMDKVELTAIRNIYNKNINNTDMTIVTGYINIGAFSKGTPFRKFSASLYHSWMNSFGYILNPVIAYFDEEEDMIKFNQFRTHLPTNLTKLVKIDREESWAWNFHNRTAEIFKNPNYPKSLPNTVYPEYSLVMHSKYYMMQRSIKEDFFGTKYYCWMDIGVFRQLADEIHYPEFKLQIPKDFTENTVAYGEVGPKHVLNFAHIMWHGPFWVAGGMFMSDALTLYIWAEEYKHYLKEFLNRGLANTDQQVIYAIENLPQHRTQIHAFKSRGKHNEWFDLGFRCKEEWQSLHISSVAT